MNYCRWILLGVNIALLTIGSIIFSGNLTIVSFVNSLFFVSFTYLIIWLFLLTVRGGFYEGITYSFRRFYYVRSRNKDYEVEWNKKASPSGSVGGPLYQYVRFQAHSLLFVFFTVFLIYYFQ